MADLVRIAIDQKDAERIAGRLGELSKALARTAIRRALNSALDTTFTTARRAVQKELPRIKARTVNARLKKLASRGDRLEAILEALNSPLPLIEFAVTKSRQKNRRGGGVAVSVKRGTKVIQHSFVARMRSGHEGIFIRETASEFAGRFKTGGSKGYRGGRNLPGDGIKVSPKSGLVGRLPVRELYGTAVGEVIGDRIDEVIDAGQRKLAAELERQIALALAKAAT